MQPQQEVFQEEPEESCLRVSFQQRGSSNSQKTKQLNNYQKECILESLKRCAELSQNSNLHEFLDNLDPEKMNIHKEEDGYIEIILH